MWDDDLTLTRLTRWSLWATALIVLWAIVVLFSRLSWFDLQQIKVNGARHVTRAQVEMVVRQHLHGNFFSADLEAARTAFTKLPWVRSASVRRSWPDGLEVSLEEHVPLARWGEDALINSYGEIYRAATAQPLPLLSGPPGSAREVAQQYASFTRALLPLGQRPVVVALNARRAWHIKLDNRMNIELGRTEMNARLNRFVALYPHTLADVTTPVHYVDLRYTNGFAVRAPLEAVQKNAPSQVQLNIARDTMEQGKSG